MKDRNASSFFGNNGWIVFLLALAAFLPSVLGGYVQDDRPAVLENRLVTGPLDMKGIWTLNFWGENLSGGKGSYRPLGAILLRCLYALGHGRAWVFHGANVVLYALSCVAVYGLLKSVFPSQRAAFFAALIFSVQAVHSEAVSSVVGVLETAACLLLVWGLLFHLRGTRRSSWLAVLLYAAGLLTKETAVGFPLFAFLIDRFKGERRSLWKPYLPYGVVFGLWVLLRLSLSPSLIGSPSGPLGNPLLGQGVQARAATALFLNLKALGLTLLPTRLLADYSVAELDAVWHLADPKALFGLMVLLLIAVLWRRCLRRAPGVSLGIAWWVLGFFPMSNLAALLPVLLAERLLLIPSIGVAAALGWAAAAVESRSWRGGILPYRLVLGAYLVLLGFFSVSRSSAWKDDFSLWQSDVSMGSKSYKAWGNLGTAYLQKNEPALGARYLEYAITVAPARADLRAQYAAALSLTHRVPEAQKEFRRAYADAPENEEVVCLYAGFLAMAGDRGSALQVLNAFLSRHPDDRRARELRDRIH